MINGVKTLIDGDHCVYCDAKVIDGLYNFCPKCGNALNVDAIRLKEQQEKRIKIELLDELACEIDDVKALNTILNKAQNI